MPEKKIKRVLRVGREEESSLSSFVERPMPTEKEVSTFERVMKQEVREQEIDSNLLEIYSDKKGRRADVQTMKARKRPIFLVRLFRRLLLLALIALAAYLVYFYFFNRGGDINSLELKITAPEKILAGEEFSYKIDYHNPTKYPLSQVHLELQYPENFIFTAANIPPTSGNYGWALPDLAPGGNATLTIIGKLISPADSVNVISGRLSYLPGSFTSQFKKEASAATLSGGPGWRVDLDYSNTAFLNQDNEMTLIFSEGQNNYLGDFNIAFSLPAETDAAVVTGDQKATSSPVGTGPTAEKIAVVKTGGASWQVSGLNPALGRQEVPLTYKIKKKSDNLEIKVRLEKKTEDGQAYVFWEKIIKPELVNSDLNLTLFLNGSKNDGAITFGQPLNYSLTYSNRGDSSYKDVVVMAALSGDFLDWNSLQNEKGGQIQNNSIIWTKQEIPELAEIKPGQEGAVDFSLGLLLFKDGDLGKNLVITAYGQYGMNNKPVKGQDNKSNTITSRINSDLSLNEEIRYFNVDNIPVGSGSLPPQVNRQTSFKVYWVVKNNLHELTDTRVVFNLPNYVSWGGKNATNVGNLYYDETSRQIIWEIGRLPVSVYRVDAEFDISITPGESDRNKILVLSPGSTVSAMDTETKDTIIRKTDPKTTKLEDDDVAGLNNSGVVQ
ncbi:MAG: hypothetical protein WC458_00085 [Patescibacteria group bacterium]